MMARTTDAKRLGGLDPRAVGLEVVERVLDHVGRLAFKLSPGYDIRVSPCHGDTNLGLTVADLCRYAQTGDTADWGGDEGAEDALLDVTAALYGQAGAGTSGSGPLDHLDEDADEQTAIGLVLLGAYGRWRLSRGEAISARELATLAGVSDDHIRLVAREDRSPLRTTGDRPYRITAASAVRWLEARGVAGFGRR